MLNHNPQVHLGSLLCQEVWLYTGRPILENPKTWESQTSFCDDEDIKESSSSSKSDKEYIWWLTWCWVLWRRVGHHGYNILCHTASLTHSLLLLICNTKLEHNNEALLFSFTHSSEKENKSVLVNEHLHHTFTLKQPHSHKDKRERERERERVSTLGSHLFVTNSELFWVLQNLKRTNGDWTPTHKTPLLPKQKQQKNVTQKKLLTKWKPTKTNTQNKTKKTPKNKTQKNLK